MNDSTTRVTPVTVLTGFLGSGKTTLLNHILRGGHGIRFGVLVNDFGEINIDARLVASIDGQSVDLSNGCVCCTMQGDLVASVRKMLARAQPPEHIVVEASGISDPLGIASAFRTPALRDRTRLDSILAVVDAENATNPILDHQLVQDQIRAADLVLLNKIDLVNGSARQTRKNWLQSIVPDVQIVETVRASAPLEVILGARGRCHPDTAHSAPRPPHDVATWAYRTEHPLAYRRVRSAIQQLGGGIFRVKGILYLADAPNIRFTAHRVGRRSSIDVLGPWGEESRATELVLLGEPGCLATDDLNRLFEQCATESFSLQARFLRSASVTRTPA